MLNELCLELVPQSKVVVRHHLARGASATTASLSTAANHAWSRPSCLAKSGPSCYRKCLQTLVLQIWLSYLDVQSLPWVSCRCEMCKNLLLHHTFYGGCIFHQKGPKTDVNMFYFWLPFAILRFQRKTTILHKNPKAQRKQGAQNAKCSELASHPVHFFKYVYSTCILLPLCLHLYLQIHFHLHPYLRLHLFLHLCLSSPSLSQLPNSPPPTHLLTSTNHHRLSQQAASPPAPHQPQWLQFQLRLDHPRRSRNSSTAGAAAQSALHQLQRRPHTPALHQK